MITNYRSKAEYNTFHGHDMREDVPYSKPKSWVGVAAAMSECHLIR